MPSLHIGMPMSLEQLHFTEVVMGSSLLVVPLRKQRPCSKSWHFTRITRTCSYCVLPILQTTLNRFLIWGSGFRLIGTLVADSERYHKRSKVISTIKKKCPYI